MPTWRASDGRGAPPVSRRARYEEPRGPRIPGIVRFLLFAGILAGVVLVTLLTALRPVIRGGVVSWAWDNPSLILRVPFVDQLVREDLGDKLTAPNPGGGTQAIFEVQPDDTVVAIGPRLQQQGFVADQRAFIYVALANDLQPHLQAGQFLLRHDMTPADLVVALVRAKVELTTVPITFREGLRIEQMTALLETVGSKVDPKAFYDLATHPTPKLLADYPWLQAAGLPQGASLEGFLYPATYTLINGSNGGPFKVTDADGLVRMLLDRFHEAVGDERMNVPAARKLTFYQVLTLASIVEHESPLDAERPLIAGVYQNRLDGVNGVAKVLNADPTVIYAVDTTKLANTPIESWKDFFFWEVPKGTKMGQITLPKALAGFQTYQRAGLPPGPIATPTISSIDAVLQPNQKDKFLYFVAIPNTQTHAFAKTLAEHNANLRKYGYQ
jgi:UPF0755 protein